MHPRPALRGAGPQPPAIDLDGNDLRRRAHPGRQLAAPASDELLVALLRQLATDLQGDAPDVAGTDLDPRQVQGEGGVGRGAQACGGLSDHLQHGRAVGVVVQTQGGPQGGKSPGGSRDSGKPAREE